LEHGGVMTEPDMPRRLPKGCVEDHDRHGNIRIYFRARGRPKVRLRGVPWTPDFMAQYDAAKGVAAPRAKGVTPGTWRWLCVKYFAECAEYKRLDVRTQHVRRQILEATFDEPIAPSSSKFFRGFPLSRMTADAVEVLRDRKIGTPEAANGRGGNGEFLERFKAYGWYLDDLVLTPVNHLPKTQREAQCVAAVNGLADRIAEYRPLAIVSVLLKIKEIVGVAAKLACSNAVQFAVPFPGNGQQARFQRDMALILPRLPIAS
jgi:hypothetical protein